MFYIKYLDPFAYTNKFIDVKAIEEMKPRSVEVVGFLVEKTDEAYFIANSTNGKTFKRIMNIPIEAIVEAREVIDTDIGIAEISYTDTQMTEIGMAFTLEKLRNLPKPPMISTCGFVVKEDNENVTLAMEKSTDGTYRTINAIPKKFVITKK